MSTEEHCYFVSSRGILKSCDFHSNNPTTESKDDVSYLDNIIKNNTGFNNMTIYVCTNTLVYFIQQILPQLKHNFILFSGDSDTTMPSEIMTKQLFEVLYHNKHLIKWFQQNTRIFFDHKIIQLPIGLNYHTIFEDPKHKWHDPQKSPLPIHQEQELIKIRENMKPFHLRTNKIYINFNIENDRFNDRKLCKDSISNNLLCVNPHFTKRTQNWMNMSQFAFVASPTGDGLDCYRTWEALLLGAIPIVTTPFFKQMFEDLPVLIVKDWKDITPQLLSKTIEDFKNKKFNYDKLTLKYWTNYKP